MISVTDEAVTVTSESVLASKRAPERAAEISSSTSSSFYSKMIQLSMKGGELHEKDREAELV